MRLPINHSLPLAALILLGATGVAARERHAAPPPPANGPAADYPVLIGDPFTIDGKTYTPADTMNYDQVGYSATGAEGGSAISGAHRTLPLPSYVEVTSLETGRTILVRLERRGPMQGDALIELSPGAAAQLGVAGHAAIRMRRVNPPEPERALLRSGQTAPVRMDTPKPLLAVLMRKLTGAPIAPAMPDPAPAASPAPVTAAAPGLTATPKPAPKPAAKQAAAPAIAAPPVRVHHQAIPATPTQPALTAPVDPAATAKPTVAGPFTVQAAVFSTKERADAAAGKLGATVSAYGRLWKMVLGPFATPADAQAGLARARASGYNDARIVRSR